MNFVLFEMSLVCFLAANWVKSSSFTQSSFLKTHTPSRRALLSLTQGTTDELLLLSPLYDMPDKDTNSQILL